MSKLIEIINKIESAVNDVSILNSTGNFNRVLEMCETNYGKAETQEALKAGYLLLIMQSNQTNR